MSSKICGIMLIFQLFYILKEPCKDLTGRRWFPLVLQNMGNPQLISTLETLYAATSLSVGANQQCLQAKLASSTTSWPSTCNISINAKKQPDFLLTLPGSGNVPFTVYSKVVDTIAGNTDMGGLRLGGSGVAESQSAVSPQHVPYIYRIEIVAERSSNAFEKSEVSVLYAY